MMVIHCVDVKSY